MDFQQEDVDAFEAALSLLDEFAPDAIAAERALLSPPIASDNQADQMSDATDSAATRKAKTKRTRKTPARPKLSEEEKKRRKAELNEKRKLLRKAGVYGDANKARNERSREIAFLREQMDKLQLELEVLQSQKGSGEEQKKQKEVGVMVRKKSRLQGANSLWKGLADQQRRRREEAERDNVMLKLAIERQKRVADCLRSLMQKRSTQLTNECSSLMTLVSKKNHVVNVLDLRGDFGDFEELFWRLEDSYRKLDDVFMANGLAGLTVSPLDLHVREGVDGNYFELSSYKALPFDVCATKEVAWNHFKGVEKHLGNGSLYEKAEKGLDEPYTIIADFKKELYSNSSRADIQVKQVIRRYIEEDRDAIVWVSRTVPIEIKHKMIRGLTYHLRGYAVTKRSPDSTPDRELSILQLCYMVSLDQETIETRYSHDDIRAITNFVVASAGQNMQAHREFIENALVDQKVLIAYSLQHT